MKKNKTFKIIALIAFILAVVGIFIPAKYSLICELIAGTTLFVIGILSWIVPSKENTILKLIILIIGYLSFLSWVITSSTSNSGQLMNLGLSRVSLYELSYYPLLAIQYFLQPLLFILVVGGLYGVLASTGKYRNRLEKIAKSMKGKEEIFLVLTALILGMLSSVFGFSLMLFTFIPAICGIILLMGYDRITAFMTTFLAPLVGIIGSTYGLYITGYINDILGTGFNTELVAKVALFVISFVIYITFVIKHAKKVKKQTADETIEELPFLGEKKQSKKASWPIAVILSLLLLLTILGCARWTEVFDTTLFTDLHDAISEWAIKDYTVLSYLIADLNAFGKWYFTEITVMIVLASILLSLVYNLKLEESIKAFGDGVKKTLKPAFLVIFAYTIVIITAYHPFIVTVTDWMMGLISSTSGVLYDLLFILVSGINTILSTVLNIDMVYVVQSTAQYINTESINVLAVLTQSLYGLTLFVAPTSTMLILGLEYLKIPYKEWLKTSWKLVLELLAVILIIIIVVTFI